VDIQKEKELITNLENQWTAAIISKDIGSVMSIIATDIAFIDTSWAVSNNREEFRKMVEYWFADTSNHFNTYTYGIDHIDVSASGDLAHVLGHSQIEISTSKGLKQVKTRFLDVWKKYDGEWKCSLNIGYNNLQSESL